MMYATPDSRRHHGHCGLAAELGLGKYEAVFRKELGVDCQARLAPIAMS